MFSEPLYEEALERLAYIDGVKQSLCTLLARMAVPSSSRMRIRVSDFDHAAAHIQQTIDELFYNEGRDARKIKEAYERQDWQAWIEELQSL